MESPMEMSISPTEAVNMNLQWTLHIQGLNEK